MSKKKSMNRFMRNTVLSKAKTLRGSISLVCICVFFSYSSAQHKTEVDTSSTQQLTVSVLKDYPDTAYFKPTSRTVLLESTAPNSQIRQIDRILQDDNKLFFFDLSLKSVFIYTANGKHIATVNNVGNGPGEYIELSDVCLDTSGKQLILLGYAPQKFLYYDYSGNFIREEKLGKLNNIKEVTYNNEAFYTVNYETDKSNCYVNAIGKQPSEAVCLMDTHIKNVYNYAKGCLLSNNNNVILTKRFDNGIYEIAGGKLRKKYVIDFGEFNIPRTYLSAGSPWDELIAMCKENSHVYTITNVCENSGYLSFSTNVPGFYVWPKSDKTIRKHPFILSTRYGIYLSRMINVDHTENSIAFFVEPRYLLAHKRDGVELSPELRELIDTIRFDDNPVLFIYEFKTASK